MKYEIKKLKQGYEVNIYAKNHSSSQWADTLETALILVYMEKRKIKGLFDVQRLTDEDQIKISKILKGYFEKVGETTLDWLDKFYEKRKPRPNH